MADAKEETQVIGPPATTLTVAGLRDAFDVYYTEMQKAQDNHCYWALLHLVVVVPDICGGLLELPGGTTSRYLAWCRPPHFPDDPGMRPGDRYQLRCGLLHAGSTVTDPERLEPAKPGDENWCQYTSFSFVEPGVAGPVEIHGAVSDDPDRDAPGRPKARNRVIDVVRLADETRAALQTWFLELQTAPELNAKVAANIKRHLARVQKKTIPPPTGHTPGSAGWLINSTSST